MTDKKIIINDINVSELTSEQLACMDRYSVAHLFIKLVETLSRTEDDYNKVQGDRVKIWTDNTDLTEQLKRKEQELEKVCKAFDIEYIIDKETGVLIGRCNELYKKEQECEKWKSYYELYRIETDKVKKVHAVINDNPKYGIEFTENDIIFKDERLSYLEIHEQVKLIINEQAKEIDLLKAENEKLNRKITEIFACLIKANRSGIITDTIWVDTITTLWDDIAQTLGIEGDQAQVEELILQKISEGLKDG